MSTLVRRVGFMVVAAAVMIWMIGCAPPTRHLGSYRESFAMTRQLTEGIILSGKTDVDRYAASPYNTDVPSVRERKRSQFQADLDVRLAALDAIDGYNGALVALATGADPNEVAGALRTLTGSLTKMIPRLATMAGPAGAAIGLASDVISAVEEGIRARKFTMAVKEGQRIMPLLFDVLGEDVQGLTAARRAILTQEYVDAMARLTTQTALAATLLDRYADGPLVKKRYADINAIRAGMEVTPPPDPYATTSPPSTGMLEALEHSPGEKGWEAGSAEDVYLKGLLAGARESAAGVAAVRAKFDALTRLQAAYQSQLEGTRDAFSALAVAVENPTIDLTAATDRMARGARDFRQAYLAFQEAK